MAQPSELATESKAKSDIHLTIRNGDSSTVFRLSPDDERVVTVGSTTSADVQFDDPMVSPIHFYFERTGPEVWLVPAYCVSGLRFNGVDVLSPRKLLSQSRLEFGSISLEVHVSASGGRAFASRSALQSSLVQYIDCDDEPTRQAWSADNEDLIATREFSAITPHRQPRPASAFETHLGSLVPKEDSAATTETLRISYTRPCRVDRRLDAPSLRSELATERLKRKVSFCIEVPSLNKTLCGVSPASNGADRISFVEQVARTRAVTRVTVPPVLVVPPRASPFLNQLDHLAKRRPVAATVLALVAALLVSFIVVSLAFAILRTRL